MREDLLALCKPPLVDVVGPPPPLHLPRDKFRDREPSQSLHAIAIPTKKKKKQKKKRNEQRETG